MQKCDELQFQKAIEIETTRTFESITRQASTILTNVTSVYKKKKEKGFPLHGNGKSLSL